MKHFCILLFLFTWTFCTALGQGTSFPKGMYMSLQELKDKKPSSQNELKVFKRTGFELALGGNDYRLEYPNLHNNKTVQEKVFAYSTGDSLFVNVNKLTGRPTDWYSLVVEEGRFLVFLTTVREFMDGDNRNFAMFGYDPITKEIKNEKNRDNPEIQYLPYVFDLEKDKIAHQLTKLRLSLIFINFPQTEKQYEWEPDKRNMATLFKYIRMINQIKKPVYNNVIQK